MNPVKPPSALSWWWRRYRKPVKPEPLDGMLLNGAEQMRHLGSAHKKVYIDDSTREFCDTNLLISVLIESGIPRIPYRADEPGNPDSYDCDDFRWAAMGVVKAHPILKRQAIYASNFYMGGEYHTALVIITRQGLRFFEIQVRPQIIYPKNPRGEVAWG